MLTAQIPFQRCAVRRRPLLRRAGPFACGRDSRHVLHDCEHAHAPHCVRGEHCSRSLTGALGVCADSAWLGFALQDEHAEMLRSATGSDAIVEWLEERWCVAFRGVPCDTHRCAVVTPQVLSQVRHEVHGPRPACANRQLVVITDCRRPAPSACSVGLLRPPAQICSSEYWQHCNSAMHIIGTAAKGK